MAKQYVADTNILLDEIEDFVDYSVVLLSHTLREIENHKSKNNKVLAYKSRKASRFIRKHEDIFHFDMKDYDGSQYGDNYYEDNRIVGACIENDYGLITNDFFLGYKARGLGIEVIYGNEYQENKKEETYDGVKEVYFTPDELQDVYNNLDLNQWDLLEGEYLIAVDDITGEHLDVLKWSNDSLHSVNKKGFRTNQFGKINPLDSYQMCALDSINSNQVTMVKGAGGSGKSLISLSASWNLIEKNKYDKLIVFTNPVKTKDSQELGFYKGTKTEKLLESSVGVMLSSKFGDVGEVEFMIQQGKLQILPFSDIRGFDTTSDKRTIVWISEAQNLNTELMKLGLQRVGDNTKVIIDGDPYTQIDSDLYQYDNGMQKASEVFREHEIYGEVTLQNIHRSRIADIAENM